MSVDYEVKKDEMFQEILRRISSYLNEEHIAYVTRAYEVADKAHAAQVRKSGEPYILHPLNVVRILSNLHVSPETLASGFLHDVVEDTDMTLDEIEEMFGKETRFIIDAVTKLTDLRFTGSDKDLQHENHRKIFVAMAEDIRVIVVKLADRLHNMRTLKHMKPEKQILISQETLDVYAPIAHRLGMYKIKWELEDLAFRYLYPESYYKIVDLMSETRQHREAYIERLTIDITQILEERQIQGVVKGRAKHLYSIYKKMNSGKDFSEIYDLFALRIVVDSVAECYAALGVIHENWKPIPGRFKDYIPTPKHSIYQSIHTTILSSNGTPVEIQIRTRDMDDVAEYGVAAHWAYKEGIKMTEQQREMEKRLTWIRQIMERNEETSRSSDFMGDLKVDVFSKTVLVFTPKSSVIELPQGATPIDFAYAIHSDIGNHLVQAQVNHRLVPLDTELKMGDVVEVVTNKNNSPSRDWLDLVKSTRTKTKIRQYFRKLEREHSIETGEEALKRYYSDKHIDKAEQKHFEEEYYDDILKNYGYETIEELYAGIGYGDVTPVQFVNAILRRIEKEEEQRKLRIEDLNDYEGKKIESDADVSVKGESGVLVHIGKCCNPLPGDPIIGHITKGNGITVHRTICRNAITSDRRIPVEWTKKAFDADHRYFTKVIIECEDRDGLINDVLLVLNNLNIKMTSITGKNSNDGAAIIALSLNVQDLEVYQRFESRIRSLQSVYDVKRVINN